MKPIATMNGSRSAARIGGTIAFRSASESATTKPAPGRSSATPGTSAGGDVDRGRQDRQRDQEPQQPDPGVAGSQVMASP